MISVEIYCLVNQMWSFSSCCKKKIVSNIRVHGELYFWRPCSNKIGSFWLWAPNPSPGQGLTLSTLRLGKRTSVFLIFITISYALCTLNDKLDIVPLWIWLSGKGITETLSIERKYSNGKFLTYLHWPKGLDLVLWRVWWPCSYQWPCQELDKISRIRSSRR